MQATVSRALRRPEIVAQAVEIAAATDGRDRIKLIRQLHDWLDARVKFIPDPLIDGDVIRTPALLLGQLAQTGMIRGDCDDVATLTATLAHSIGIPARFVTLGFFRPDAPFSHVFTELQDQHGEWHALDVTETKARRSVSPVSRRAEHPAVIARPSAAATLGILLAAGRLVYLGARFVDGLFEEGDEDV